MMAPSHQKVNRWSWLCFQSLPYLNKRTSQLQFQSTYGTTAKRQRLTELLALSSFQCSRPTPTQYMPFDTKNRLGEKWILRSWISLPKTLQPPYCVTRRAANRAEHVGDTIGNELGTALPRRRPFTSNAKQVRIFCSENRGRNLQHFRNTIAAVAKCRFFSFGRRPQETQIR